MFNQCKRILLVAAVAAILGVSGTQVASAGCKPRVTGSSVTAYTVAVGKSRAKLRWRAKVIGTYGPLYALWAKAKNRGFKIQQIGISKYRIWTYGRPCK